MAEIVELQPRDLALIRKIERAFASVRREDGMSWHEAEEVDNHGSKEEVAAARRLDTDARWQDVSVEMMDQLPSAVAFLDSKGFRYYLTAFLVADLKQRSWKSAVDDGFDSYLMSESRARELLPLLSTEQREVVAEWLELGESRRVYGERRDLGIWKSFLPNPDLKVGS